MRRKLLLCVLAVTVVFTAVGCHKKSTNIKTIEYSDVMGIAEGTVDFDSVDSPEINIKEIQTYVGAEIDYSSAVDVKNTEKFDDFQMWVDATSVDIYTVGKYTATYKFVYDENTLEKSVSVTVLDKEAEAGSIGSQNVNSQNGIAQNGNAGGDSASAAVDGFQAEENVGNSHGEYNADGSVGDDAGNGNNVDNSAAGGVPDGGSNGGNQSGNSSENQGNNSGSQENVSHEIVTTVKGSTKVTTIGYTNIELLSGSYVKIKCTNAKYIVSTRTDVSETTKNDKRYSVSKLIITYNTGAEQILETVEKSID